MRHFGETFIMVAVIAILGSLTLGKLAACAPATSPEVAKSSAYGVELNKCLAGKTYDEREQCALSVDAKFGVKR